MSEEEKKAIKYFYNIRATIDESNMLFDKDVNIRCGKETIKQITILFNLIEKQQNKISSLEKQIKLMQNCDLARTIKEQQKEIEEIRDKAEVMDYYNLNDVIDDLSKVIGDFKEDDD